ncbi:ATP-dependent DNA helicase [Quillaja saponaria]|uniref:ATP-dependent DNA helicase n=1 Tax=Quillaja saponaria TaxID=32244 RepID=A0AAD7KW19_QUISA|nr:ATP-dependent DNA helicase [Quillaja saponaria]
MTCNPSWAELKKELQPHEEAQNRPDLIARIFKAKLGSLRDDLLKKHVLGHVAAYVYVIEFQKRGLPHVHFLLIMKNESKIINPDNYDDFVAAEIPAESENPHLRKMVLKHMIHGPCGPLNATSPCVIKSSGCKSHYPKQFCSASIHGSDSYPIYRRRDTGEMVKVRGHMIDNRWVVPYNAHLLAKYDCHTNVEICSTVKAVKYLYKYIYKGHDRISFQINDVQST